MSEFEDEVKLIELVDDNGETTVFEHLATLEYEGEAFLVVGTPDDGSDDEESEVFVLKIEQDEDGNDIYVDPDDDELSEKVFNRFLELMEETVEDDE